MTGKSTTTAAAKFAATLDILWCFGNLIRSRKTLRRLTLTSRLFHEVFTPVLYSELHIKSDTLDDISFSHDCTYLKHVRKLSVTVQPHLSNHINAAIRDLLPRLPSLSSFTWTGGDVGQETLLSLHSSCKQIRSLHIEYDGYDLPSGDDWLELGEGSDLKTDDEADGYTEVNIDDALQDESDEEGSEGDIDIDMERHHWPYQALSQPPDFTTFTDLTELGLRELRLDLIALRPLLVGLLICSPNLRRLSLSISESTCRYYFNYAISQGRPRHGREVYLNFFKDLCEDYGKTGSPPLRLKSLDCGQSVFMPTGGLLEQLTDLDRLEELFVSNEHLVDLGWVWNRHQFMDVDQMLQAHSLPNLRRIVMDGSTYSFTQFARSPTGQRLMKRLAVLVRQHDWYPQTTQLFRTWSIPRPKIQVRMISLVIWRDVPERIDPDEILHSSQPLVHLVNSTADTLEGLLIGAKTKRCLEDTFNMIVDLTAALNRLPKLTQLSVFTYRWRLRDGSLVVSDSDIERMAVMLARAARRLRYLHLAGFFWEIQRREDGWFRLVELEPGEREAIELFQMAEQGDVGLRCL